jgi:hypothetical protein
MWVHSELGTIPAVGLEDFMCHIAGYVEGGIQGKRGMTLGHHEAVAVRIIRPAFEHASVQAGEDICNRQSGADVTNIRPLRLFEHVASDVLAGD